MVHLGRKGNFVAQPTSSVTLGLLAHARELPAEVAFLLGANVITQSWVRTVQGP